MHFFPYSPESTLLTIPPLPFLPQHPQYNSLDSKAIVCLCAEDQSVMQRWMVAIRIAKVTGKISPVVLINNTSEYRSIFLQGHSAMLVYKFRIC